MDEFKDAIKKNWRLLVFVLIVILVLIFISFYKKEKKIQIKNERESINPIEEVVFESKNYKANEYQIIKVNDADILEDYFRDFLKNALNNPEEAYKRLSEESKAEYNSVTKFKEHIDKITTIKTKNNKIAYFKKDKNKENTYQIIDTEENKYTLYEKAVWDYEITLNPKIK